ncbi:MAG TPA: DNA translocase FtsK [Clostridiaceae bacterium]|nr:DNA translocase FtsK [Clostridiaceae bacterium]
MVLEKENQQNTTNNNIYEIPPIELLNAPQKNKSNIHEISDNAATIQKGLYNFGVNAKITNVSIGPVFTTYEIELAEGTRISTIEKLKNDIAYLLGAESLDIIKIPSKSLVGIQVKNKERQNVCLKEMLDSDEFESNKSNLIVAIGKEANGKIKLLDLKESSNILISGSTGSGKTMLLSSIICSILYKAHPNEVKLIIIDTKNGAESNFFMTIPHLLIPPVTNIMKAYAVLKCIMTDLQNRYNVIVKKNCSNINEYNQRTEITEKLPDIVVIIDEFEELCESEFKAEIEELMFNITRNAEKVGIHFIVATTKPESKIISGRAKSNFLTRIAFKASLVIDSQLTINSPDAKYLLGNGDMLLKEKWSDKCIRCQATFVSDDEINKIVDFINLINNNNINNNLLDIKENTNIKPIEDSYDEEDPLLKEVIEYVIESGEVSISNIQRKTKVGYARAGRIIDQMEEKGIISPYRGSKPREVLISKKQWNEINNKNDDEINTIIDNEKIEINKSNENINQNDKSNIIEDSEIVKEKQNPVIKILLWIFLFPVMLILFILKNNNLSNWKKAIIIIAIVWITVLIF